MSDPNVRAVPASPHEHDLRAAHRAQVSDAEEALLAAGLARITSQLLGARLYLHRGSGRTVALVEYQQPTDSGGVPSGFALYARLDQATAFDSGGMALLSYLHGAPLSLTDALAEFPLAGIATEYGGFGKPPAAVAREAALSGLIPVDAAE